MLEGMRSTVIAPLVACALGVGCAYVLGVGDVRYADQDGGPVEGGPVDAGPCARLCPSGGCTPVLFAAGAVNALAIGNGFVYWVDAAKSTLQQQRVGLGGTTATVRTGSASSTMAVDTDGSLFVTDEDAGTVSSCTTTKCTPIASSLHRPTGIILDQDFVYFGTHGDYPNPSPPNVGVFRVPKTGGSPELLHDDLDFRLFAIDDTNSISLKRAAARRINCRSGTPRASRR
jgi:hypothetical protein